MPGRRRDGESTAAQQDTILIAAVETGLGCDPVVVEELVAVVEREQPGELAVGEMLAVGGDRDGVPGACKGVRECHELHWTLAGFNRLFGPTGELRNEVVR